MGGGREDVFVEAAPPPAPPLFSCVCAWISLSFARCVSPSSAFMGDVVCTHTSTSTRVRLCLPRFCRRRHAPARCPLSHSLAGPLWCRVDVLCSLLCLPQVLLPLRDVKANSHHRKDHLFGMKRDVGLIFWGRVGGRRSRQGPCSQMAASAHRCSTRV